MNDTTTPSSEMATVLLIGGPDDWRDRTLTHMTPDELTGPRTALGSYLISSHVPADHPDPGARAVYEPNGEPWPADVWFFRGWFPVGPADAELRTVDQHEPVDVETDNHGLPTGWVTDEGERHRVDRVLTHWEGTSENDLAADVWHVRSDNADYELLSHPGHWEVGRLPAVEAQEHDGLLA